MKQDIFIRPFEKNRTYYGNTCGLRAGSVQSICALNDFNGIHCIISKLCENVCWQNISAKFDNQPDHIKHFGVMALELAKIAKINLVRSDTKCFSFDHHQTW